MIKWKIIGIVQFAIKNITIKKAHAKITDTLHEKNRAH